MKFVLLLMFYMPSNGSIVSVVSAEFDDLAACQAAEPAAVRLMRKAGDKYSYATECLPKSSAPQQPKK